MYAQKNLLRERFKMWTPLFALLLILSAPIWLSSCGKNSTTNGNSSLLYGQSAYGTNGFNQLGFNTSGGCAPVSGPIPIALSGIYMDQYSIRGGMVNGQSVGQVVVAGSTTTNSSFPYRGQGTMGNIGLNILVQAGGYAQGGVQGGIGYVGGTGLIQLSTYGIQNLLSFVQNGQITIPGLIYQPNNSYYYGNNTNISQIASQVAVCAVGLNLSWYGYGSSTSRVSGSVQLYFNGNSSAPYTIYVY